MSWVEIDPFVLDQVFGYQTANFILNNLIALASVGPGQKNLGGSRQTSLPLAGAVQDAIDYLDVQINGDNITGLTVSVEVECRTDDAGTSITPKLRNITTAADSVVGAACAATTFAGTNGTQSLTPVIAGGLNKYRLQGTPSNATNPTYLIGYIKIGADA